MQTICRWFDAIAVLIPIYFFGSIFGRDITHSLWSAEDRGKVKSLYKELGENSNPRFATVVKIERAIGVKFHAEAA